MGVGRRGRERAREGEGQHVGYVAHPGDLGVVLRRVAVYHMRAERAPESAGPLERDGVGRARHDAGRALEEIGAGMLEAAQMAARHRVRSDVAHAAGQQARQRLAEHGLHAADVGDDAAGAQHRRDPLHDLGHREHRRREHDQVRLARGFGVAPAGVDRAAPQRSRQRIRAARGAHDPPGHAPRLRRERDRAAEQAQPQHRDTLEARRQFPASRSRRSASIKRSFSLRRPTLMRT